MKRKKRNCLLNASIVVLLMISALEIRAQNPPNDANWELMWSDDFTAFNGTRWSKENSSNSLYSYSSNPENIYFNGSELIIKVVSKNNIFTTGLIKTREPYHLYGYFEIECKMPSGKAMFPAFWLHGCTWINDQIGCIEQREVDVFEHAWGEMNEFKHSSGFYWNYQGGVTPEEENIHLVDRSLYKNFNKFGLEWSPKTLIYTLNELPYKSYCNDERVPNKNMALIANLALNNSSPDLSNPEAHEFRIKNIKYYKLKCDCEQDITITSSTQLNSYIHSVKKNILINGINIKLNQGNKAGLRAANEITISGDFEIPLGCDFYALTHGCSE